MFEAPADPASLSRGVELILAGLDLVADVAPAELPGAQALLETSALLVAQDRLKAITLARVADVEARQLYALDGNGSVTAWVSEQHTSMTRGEVALARRLDRVPQVAEAIAAGRISLDGGVAVSQALTRLRPHVDRPDGEIDRQPAEQVLPAVIVDGVVSLVCESRGGLPDDHPLLASLLVELQEIALRPVSQLERLEAAFLVLARLVEPTSLRGALRVLTDALLPNQLEQDADDSDRNRSFALERHDDRPGWSVRGELDDECGELLHTALTAAMATDPDNPADTEAAAAARAAGDEPFAGLRYRGKPQRRHDGLKLLLRRLLDSGALGNRGKVPVQVAVTISESALHGVPGALPGRTGSGATVAASLARRWVCDSALTRFVLSLGHRVVESSHADRTLKPHERRIKQIETGGVCQAAGCSRGSPTGDPLIPHHVLAYARTGTTSLDDTVLLCEVSHHDVHEGHRTLRLKDGRHLDELGWRDGPSGSLAA